VTRRLVLGLAGAAAGVALEARFWPVGAQRPPATPDGPHAPRVTVPTLTSNGAKVPIVIEMTHPMEPGHFIESLAVSNAHDPVPSKGVFHFSPANGQAYLSFQARMDDGRSSVVVEARCTQHGVTSVSAPLQVAEGGGGCAGAAPGEVLGAETIRPPAIRIRQLVTRERLHPDELIDVQIKVRHPNRTGLERRDGAWRQVAEAFHLSEVEVFHGAERVSRFVPTAALSDDPLLGFRLRAARAEPLRVVLTNTRGQRFEAVHPIPLG
jgi:sulfur-oxidizing protein SoxY